mgnify:CR=1 FL=1
MMRMEFIKDIAVQMALIQPIVINWEDLKKERGVAGLPIMGFL